MVMEKVNYPKDWELVELGSLFEFKNGLNKEKKAFGEGTPIVNYVDVYKSNCIESKKLKGKVTLSQAEIKRYEVKKGDVFFTRTSETIEDIGLASVVIDEPKETVFSGFILRARPKNKKLELYYKKYCFSTPQVRREIIKKSTYTTRALTNGTHLSKVLLALPPANEQKAIAHILGLMDETINKNDKLIAQKELRKKWLMQNLLTGKKRLKGFTHEKWQTKSLQNILNPVSRLVDKPQSAFLALGIRSHGKGTFLKPDFDPKKIDMDVLYEVKENDLILNITFAWEGAIAIVKKEDDGALVSHRFPTFTFNSKTGVTDYFRHLIVQQRFKYMMGLISPGGAGRNRVLSKKDFLKLEVKIPSLEEQKAIAKILQAADKEIQLLKAKTEKLKEQKQWLMQVLLTGKKRLNIKDSK